MMKKKSKLNMCLFISLLLGILYCLYLVSYFGKSLAGSQGAEQLGVGLAITIIIPHAVMTFIAVIFNALGVFMKKAGFALVGAILYTVALVLFIPYFMFVIIEMICSFVGYAQLAKSKKKMKEEIENV